MNEEDAILIAQAEMGEQAKAFLESELGRVLIGMAEQDAQAAREALELVPPTETNTIMTLQNKARCARNFESWLKELVSRGEESINIWKQRKGE